MTMFTVSEALDCNIIVAAIVVVVAAAVIVLVEVAT